MKQRQLKIALRWELFSYRNRQLISTADSFSSRPIQQKLFGTLEAENAPWQNKGKFWIDNKTAADSV